MLENVSPADARARRAGTTRRFAPEQRLWRVRRRDFALENEPQRTAEERPPGSVRLPSELAFAAAPIECWRLMISVRRTQR